MKWRIIAVGKPALAYAKAGVAEYLQRLTRMAKVDLVYLKDGRPDEVAARFEAAIQPGLRVVLDERGDLLSTGEFTKKIDNWELSGTKAIHLLIGGADGHPEAQRKSADLVWALSPMTLQHELALVVLLEQIYRAYSIKRGTPYHR